eukprot:SAG22_NODE_991_length_6129_cov_8.370813_6_plen_128_part_00
MLPLSFYLRQRLSVRSVCHRQGRLEFREPAAAVAPGAPASLEPGARPVLRGYQGAFVNGRPLGKVRMRWLLARLTSPCYVIVHIADMDCGPLGRDRAGTPSRLAGCSGRSTGSLSAGTRRGTGTSTG